VTFLTAVAPKGHLPPAERNVCLAPRWCKWLAVSLAWHFGGFKGQGGFGAWPGGKKRRRKQRAAPVKARGKALVGCEDAEPVLQAGFPAGVNHTSALYGLKLPLRDSRSTFLLPHCTLLCQSTLASLHHLPGPVPGLQHLPLLPMCLFPLPISLKCLCIPALGFKQAGSASSAKLRVCALWSCMCVGE